MCRAPEARKNGKETTKVRSAFTVDLRADAVVIAEAHHTTGERLSNNNNKKKNKNKNKKKKNKNKNKNSQAGCKESNATSTQTSKGKTKNFQNRNGAAMYVHGASSTDCVQTTPRRWTH